MKHMATKKRTVRPVKFLAKLNDRLFWAEHAVLVIASAYTIIAVSFMLAA